VEVVATALVVLLLLLLLTGVAFVVGGTLAMEKGVAVKAVAHDEDKKEGLLWFISDCPWK
jgi:hypothetical protein